MAARAPSGESPPNTVMEIVQPFIDLIHVPRALWGINLAYVFEGMVYFCTLGYLAKHFSDFIYKGAANANIWSCYGMYRPAEGPQNTQFMWLVFACIAMMSPVLLSLARNWIGQDFKTKA